MRLFGGERKPKDPVAEGAQEAVAPAGAPMDDPDSPLEATLDPPTVELTAAGVQAEESAPQPGSAEGAEGAAGAPRRGGDSADAVTQESDAAGEPVEQPAVAGAAAPAFGGTPEGRGGFVGEGDDAGVPAAADEQPAADVVASNGTGPAGQIGARAPYGEDAWWQRPEAAVGAAFVGGLLLAAILKRRRS
ncbi:MAG: hypothetical protein KGJ43_06055 [Acidobacteriota bacterium]|nr:hypothetical protein [Acidobacteriota bacterium]